MPRLPRKITAYRLDEANNLAVVTLEGRNQYLGPFRSAESKSKYDRLMAEWLAAGRHAPPPPPGGRSPGLMVDELTLQFWRFAEGHCLWNERPTRELDNTWDALRLVRKLYCQTLAADFRPSYLKDSMKHSTN